MSTVRPSSWAVRGELCLATAPLLLDRLDELDPRLRAAAPGPQARHVHGLDRSTVARAYRQSRARSDGFDFARQRRGRAGADATARGPAGPARRGRRARRSSACWLRARASRRWPGTDPAQLADPPHRRSFERTASTATRVRRRFPTPKDRNAIACLGRPTSPALLAFRATLRGASPLRTTWSAARGACRRVTERLGAGPRR